MMIRGGIFFAGTVVLWPETDAPKLLHDGQSLVTEFSFSISVSSSNPVEWSRRRL